MVYTYMALSIPIDYEWFWKRSIRIIDGSLTGTIIQDPFIS